ncbi:L-type lectin-domain containing receptor kinase SIT2-like [Curcuma longa]|uniref:L-type lectin-domain containing receptor kinase SIT2-like n=1 Tax=Curcuma longa TaxID=136217 RepID=UPI003D9EFE50
MLLKTCLFLLLLFFFFLFQTIAASSDGFLFNGFRGVNLTLEGLATITTTGLLMLTNTTKEIADHAFYPSKFNFKNPSDGSVFSFSTTFVFGIVSVDPNLSGHGIVFIISPTEDFSSAIGSQYLGLVNLSSNGESSNHLFAVELDTIQNPEFGDINDNHVGVDINGLRSRNSSHAGYYPDDGQPLNNLTLRSGQVMQVWVDYDGKERRVDVTLAPARMTKPKKPLLSTKIDLAGVLMDSMFVGFASATGPFLTSHYILGWSFSVNGTAQALDFSLLPSLPRTKSSDRSKLFDVLLPLASAIFVLAAITVALLIVRRKMTYAEELEEWEMDYSSHRFSYKDLHRATRGFRDKELLGIGGFGRVYKGVLPSSRSEIAVKRVSHESRQGMREFIAEVVSLGRLCHRNLVPLLGYCRRKRELLLVYDYMRNGSLDKFLHDSGKPALSWAARLKIIKGVAAGLLYLHQDWEQVVIHRDIKASNVLLDEEFNARLGDFGLARLYDHGADLTSTNVVGTMGYLAPELARTGKSSTATDVFAFGTFVLEVVCGRRPVSSSTEEQVVLVDWVVQNWRTGSITATRDARMGEEYEAEEVELALKVGLLCSHPLPAARPSMRQTMRYLEGEEPLPELSPTYMSFSVFALLHNDGFDDYLMSFPSTATASGSATSVATASSVYVSGR